MRTLIFKSLFFTLTPLFVILLSFTVFAPGRETTCRGVQFWGKAVLFILEKAAHVRVEYRGLENLPREGPYIICPKHESTIDAFAALKIFYDVTALAKSELFEIPFLGIVLRKIGLINVRRGKGTAHQDLPDVAGILRESKRPILIYPEGTRVPVGKKYPLKSGAYYIQAEADIPVFTVATNAGLFWPRNRFWIKPGTALVEIHAAMPTGLSKEEFMQELEKRVVDRSNELHRLAKGN